MEPGVAEVASILGTLGCPPDRVEVMAAQLIRRAHQLAGERSWTTPDALAHLLRLMAGGWASQARGFSAESFPPAPPSGPSTTPPHAPPAGP